MYSLIVKISKKLWYHVFVLINSLKLILMLSQYCLRKGKKHFMCHFLIPVSTTQDLPGEHRVRLGCQTLNTTFIITTADPEEAGLAPGLPPTVLHNPVLLAGLLDGSPAHHQYSMIG